MLHQQQNTGNAKYCIYAHIGHMFYAKVSVQTLGCGLYSGQSLILNTKCCCIVGDAEASFTKEEMQQGKHQEYEKKLHEQLLNTYNHSSISRDR
jgi:hypothetical protein